MYICVTDVDADSKIPCNVAPMRTGPSIPEVKGIQVDWCDESTYPIELAKDGTYLRATKYYGTCDDDADVSIAGVLEVLTEIEFIQRKRTEFYARKHFTSWVFDEATLIWSAPIPMPTDGMYAWDEETISWIKLT